MTYLLPQRCCVAFCSRRFASSVAALSSPILPSSGIRVAVSSGSPLSNNKAVNLQHRSILSAVMAAGNDDIASGLREQTCVGKCGRDTPRLSDDAINKHMAAVPDWRLNDERTVISKSFVARNFVAAVDFFNVVKELAEAETHHPDLHLTNYRNVRVELWTHSIGGLALPDFILAAKIDQLEVDYSPKWLREKKAKDDSA